MNSRILPGIVHSSASGPTTRADAHDRSSLFPQSLFVNRMDTMRQRNRSGYCDGIHRRDFIQAGMAGAFGLSLADLYRLRAASSTPQSERAVIYVFMGGGPTQHETYDPKPDAPAEYRGPFGVVSTTHAGVYFSEYMARQAKVTDKLAVIRSIGHDSGSHQSATHYTQSGYYLKTPSNKENEMPNVGSVISKVRGPNHHLMPAFVSLAGRLRYGSAGWLGGIHNPLIVSQDVSRPDFRIPNLDLLDGVSLDRLADRRRLLRNLDSAERYYDSHGTSEAIDKFSQQAFETVRSGRIRRAFDLSTEDSSTRELYGINGFGQGLLLARRLAQSGVPFISINSGGWDNHGAEVCGFTLEDSIKRRGPDFDQGIAGLVTDIYQRGLDKNILLVCIGEFGRTPKVNSEAGRDHWGPLMSMLISGGGLRVGQVIGASDPYGGHPVQSAYRPENVLAMIYRHLDINPAMTITDPNGRPQYLLEQRGLIKELI